MQLLRELLRRDPLERELQWQAQENALRKIGAVAVLEKLATEQREKGDASAVVLKEVIDTPRVVRFQYRWESQSRNGRDVSRYIDVGVVGKNLDKPTIRIANPDYIDEDFVWLSGAERFVAGGWYPSATFGQRYTQYRRSGGKGVKDMTLEEQLRFALQEAGFQSDPDGRSQSVVGQRHKNRNGGYWGRIF